MATISNTSELELPICNDPLEVVSNEVVTEIIDVTINKEANCNYAVVGGNICYTITIESSCDLDGVVFKDQLSNSVEYINGSFTVNDEPRTPTISADYELSYTFDLKEGTTVIKFCVHVIAVPVVLDANGGSTVVDDTAV